MAHSVGNPNAANIAQDFTDEQKHYLQGFVSGAQVARTTRGLPTFAATLEGLGTTPAQHVRSKQRRHPATRMDLQHQAQNRFLEAGKQLSAEEQAKRRKHPLDMWDELGAACRRRAISQRH